jgi:hypothetical protein
MVVLQLGNWTWGLKAPHHEKVAYYGISQRDMNGFFVSFHECSKKL